MKSKSQLSLSLKKIHLNVFTSVASVNLSKFDLHFLDCANVLNCCFQGIIHVTVVGAHNIKTKTPKKSLFLTKKIFGATSNSNVYVVVKGMKFCCRLV